MSWSMINFRNAWAHAHDWEQALFMSMAPYVVEQSNICREISWLIEWKEYWIEHKETYANGCSDIALERFLTSKDKEEQFLEFLNEYDAWLDKFESQISTDEMNEIISLKQLYLTVPCKVSELQEFSRKVSAVVLNDFSHPGVERSN